MGITIWKYFQFKSLYRNNMRVTNFGQRVPSENISMTKKRIITVYFRCFYCGLENGRECSSWFGWLSAPKKLKKACSGKKFNSSATNDDIAILSSSCGAKSTVKNNTWALQVLYDWIVEQNSRNSNSTPKFPQELLHNPCRGELNYWLPASSVKAKWGSISHCRIHLLPTALQKVMLEKESERDPCSDCLSPAALLGHWNEFAAFSKPLQKQWRCS